MSPALNSVTAKFVDNYSNTGVDREEAFDPTTFLAFGELILELIKKIQECRGTTPSSVRSISESPKLGQRLLLRSHLIHKMGRREFRARGDEVISALLKTGTEATDEELDEVWKEAEAD